MRMNFGKYRGREVDTLPRGYLRWLLTLELGGDLKTAVEYGLRGEPYDPPDAVDVDDLVHKICRPVGE